MKERKRQREKEKRDREREEVGKRERAGQSGKERLRAIERGRPRGKEEGGGGGLPEASLRLAISMDSRIKSRCVVRRFERNAAHVT